MIYELSDLMIEKVYSASTIYTEVNTKTRRTDRPRWAIVIKYEGETIYYSNGREILSNSNQMVILPKGCSYDWICTKSGHYCIIEFECQKKLDTILRFPIKNSASILKIMKNLESKRLRKAPMYEMESIKDTYAIILKLCEALEEQYIPSQKLKKLAPAMEYISQNYNTEIRNDDLAKLIGVSTVYFRKLFTEIYGVSPINYIKQLRINKAKEMLRSDYGSITDIATSLGYLNIYDFSRDFKKHVGVSPRKYAEP